MADKIFVYLTGAGASCNALPMTQNFAQKLLDCYHGYKKFREDLKSQKATVSTDSIKHEGDFLRCLEWLIDEVKRHASIDTYAKKLIIRRDQAKLIQLKATLSTFFVIEQARNMVDQRYDSFFASVIEYDPYGKVTWPKNLKVITWNYDMQLEKAFHDYYPNDKFIIEHIALSHDIVRLNGVAGTLLPGHIGDSYTCILKPYTVDTVLTALDMFGKYMEDPSQYKPDIKFAWEQQENYIDRIIAPITSVADILIVIGYSFPFFNRSTDRKILNQMKGLQKVYVQVPKDSHASVRNRLSTLRNDLPEPLFVEDIERFYIPYEY